MEQITHPTIHFWSYDRFRSQLYCVLDTKNMVTEKHEFFKTTNGTIILSPIKEEMFSADFRVNMGQVRKLWICALQKSFR
ncbi:unnamed protein product [Dicrocoelium dendriticum]|nr:unnamed protein product [Dicrocoelium dendriticum]